MTRPVVPCAWVSSVAGLTITTEGVPGQLGDRCWIETPRSAVPAEIVGFGRASAVLMPLGPVDGLRPDCRVIGTGAPGTLPLWEAVRGRLVNGIGGVRDGGARVVGPRLPLMSPPPAITDRRPLTTPWVTGLRILDVFATLAFGQRVGIFAGPGVGKSTLLLDLLSQAPYDVAVVALIGERGREAAAFWQALTPHTRSRTITVVALSDDPPLQRLAAVDAAHRWAEAATEAGQRTLLVVDSITRAAHAAREVGLATGEPPTARGYPPSLFNRLPRWFERAGAFRTGTCTALYTVLLDADDPEDPVGDAVRGLLDGHILLDRERAERRAFPAVDPLKSLSRAQDDLLNATQRTLVTQARRALSRAQDLEDMVAVGAYQRGRDPALDTLLDQAQALNDWVIQERAVVSGWNSTWEDLARLVNPAP
ncbi:MAG: hypothetical protein ACP5QO_12940 [Clostridia bacterium]